MAEWAFFGREMPCQKILLSIARLHVGSSTVDMAAMVNLHLLCFGNDTTHGGCWMHVAASRERLAMRIGISCPSDDTVEPACILYCTAEAVGGGGFMSIETYCTGTS